MSFYVGHLNEADGAVRRLKVVLHLRAAHVEAKLGKLGKERLRFKIRKVLGEQRGACLGDFEHPMMSQKGTAIREGTEEGH